MTTTKQRRLTKAEKQALKSISDGADICSPVLARTLRDIEKHHPELLTICGPMGTYAVHEKLPYFGAITTAAGRKAVA